MSAPEVTGPRAVMRDPDRGPYVTDDDGVSLEDGVGWDLSWGCRVSFGDDDPAGLVVAVSMSEEDQRKGITNRLATPEQVRRFARDLLALADAAEGRAS